MHPHALSNAHVVIMAGGIGSRFWPKSRTALPKQFLDLLGTGHSLLQDTYNRFIEIIPAERIFVVTNQQYVGKVQEQLPELPALNILAEPTGRNTAPCIAFATEHIARRSPQATIVASPADHLILNTHSFLRDIQTALEVAARQEVIVTLGIHPTRPDTGYGYIQLVDDRPLQKGVFPVKTFTEKPTLEVARMFIKTGEFVWNSGIFVYAAHTMQQAFHEYLPDMAELFHELPTDLQSEDGKAKLADIYARSKNISIDFGVMEKAPNTCVIRSRFGWSDLGTWASLHKQLPHDSHNNAIVGKAILHASKGNIVHIAEGKLAVLKGINNMIVVDAGDVLLLCKRNDEQSIRDILADLKGRSEGEGLV